MLDDSLFEVAREVEGYLSGMEKHAYKIDLFNSIKYSLSQNANIDDAIHNELKNYKPRLERIFGKEVSAQNIIDEIWYSATAQRVIDAENKYSRTSGNVRVHLVHNDEFMPETPLKHFADLAKLSGGEWQDFSTRLPAAADVNKAMQFAIVSLRHNTQELWAKDLDKNGQATTPAAVSLLKAELRMADLPPINIPIPEKLDRLKSFGKQLAHEPNISTQDVPVLNFTVTGMIQEIHKYYVDTFNRVAGKLNYTTPEAKPFCAYFPSTQERIEVASTKILALEAKIKELNNASDDLSTSEIQKLLDKMENLETQISSLKQNIDRLNVSAPSADIGADEKEKPLWLKNALQSKEKANESRTKAGKKEEPARNSSPLNARAKPVNYTAKANNSRNNSPSTTHQK